MDWQPTTLTICLAARFQGLIRRAPAFAEPELIARSAKQWNRAVVIPENAVARARAYIAADHFTLSDVAIGLSGYWWRIARIHYMRAPALSAKGAARNTTCEPLVQSRIPLMREPIQAVSLRSFARRIPRASAALMPRMRS